MLEGCFLLYESAEICIENRLYINRDEGFPGGSDGKESACSMGDLALISGSGTSLEKVMATHSSALAWSIPWIEEPGELQSMGSQRVGHD